jgi:hypothetical protein
MLQNKLSKKTFVPLLVTDWQPSNVLHPMERVGTLINKLKEQFEQQVGADRLAVTAQLLLAELQKNNQEATTKTSVSVVLPSVNTRVPANPTPIAEAANNWLFEPNPEIPTLAHQAETSETHVQHKAQKPVKKQSVEFNSALALQAESLNEKLKEEKVEVMTALQDAPVRDLKKAIGVNDRYLFVNDLFRGDESMYERSIKTINSFNIFPEAQYWIQRELKVKLSWPDNSETVRLFDQVIKRRFS